MRGRWGLVLLTGLAVLSCRCAHAAVDVRLRGLQTDAGPAYDWKITSRLVSPSNLTLYGNQTSAATFNIVAKRTTTGTGYTITGRVVVTNSPDSSDMISVESMRLLLGPGLPLWGPTPKYLDCKSRDMVPGDSVSCAFAVHLSTPSTNSIKPVVEIRGARPVQGDTIPITFPAAATADSSKSCAFLKDSIVSTGAEKGFRISGTAAAEQLFTAQGAKLCEDMTSFTYTAKVGPFGELDVCGIYQFKNNPQMSIGFGNVDVTPATGNLVVSGCRQKDVLGLFKPDIAITKLVSGKLADTVWNVTTNASRANESEPIFFNSSVVVNMAVNITKSITETVDGLMGDITLTNNQLVPYVISAVRLLLTSESTGQQRTVDVTCPLSAQGAIMVPPQLMTNLPGALSCKFDFPLDGSFAAGTVQAQYKTMLSSVFEVDSGLPRPYSLAPDATTLETDACVDVWVRRINNESEVTAAEKDSNQELLSTMGFVSGQNYRIAASRGVVGGTMPPLQNGMLNIPRSVCSNTTLEWSESYGPFTKADCGNSWSALAVTVKPKSGTQQPINAVLSSPLSIRGCGLVPQVSIAEVQLTSKKVFRWSIAKKLTPAEGLSLNYKQQGSIKYDVSYNRDFSLVGRKLQGLVSIVNPHPTQMGIKKVMYSISRPSGEAPITGVAVCNESFVGAAHAATNFAAAAADANTSATLPKPVNGVLSFTLPASELKPTPGGADKNIDAQQKQPTAPLPPGANQRVKGQPEGQSGEAEDSGMAPQPYYCSFVADLPDDFAAEVSVDVETDKGEQVHAAAPEKLDWNTATLYESGRCAQVSSAFQQTQPATLLQPASLTGAMPPALDKAARLCEPKTYSFTASYGPFRSDQCGGLRSVITATVSVPGIQNLTVATKIATINVLGCPDSLPFLTLSQPNTTQIASTYEWTLERTMQPLAPASAAATSSSTAPGVRAARPLSLSISANAGSVALFNQTITFKRSPIIPLIGENQRFQVRGFVNVTNPGDIVMQLSEVQVKLIQPAVGQLVVIKAVCPATSLKPAAAAKGMVVVIPPTTAAPGGQSVVSCSYAAILNSPERVEIVAVAVMATDGRWAKSENNLNVDFAGVTQVTTGGCLRVSESQTLMNMATKQTLPEPGFVGTRLPKSQDTICNSKSYQTIGQIGPLGSKSSGGKPAGGSSGSKEGCAAVKYHSMVTAEPTSGSQGKLSSAGELVVSVNGCSQ